MKIPLGWLREFVPIDIGAVDLAELITPRGVLVEEVLRPWRGLEGVIVAQVVDVQDHPRSDKLCVARVQTGSGELEVVVGVRNMRPGDLVPLAPPGARVPGLPEPLGTRQIRGVTSNGMLCSPRELALGEDHEGILLLNDEAPDLGTDLAALLQLSEVLDIEVEPNRPDFLSVLGVAREVAAATGMPLVITDQESVQADDLARDAVPEGVNIVNPDRCTRYLAKVICDMPQDGRTPLLAQARLMACGMRPIAPVVDATNYAMLELGQPLHAFDLASLAGPGIVVRLATEGERITTLDATDRALTDDDLVICDTERPVAIAGVMGGASSEVGTRTTDLLLESAHFSREGIMRTSRRLDLGTEASQRFERGVDPEGLERSAERAAQLITAWTGGGAILSGAVGAGSVPVRPRVAMRPSRAGALLGHPVSDADAVAVFDELGLEHREVPGALEVEVPGYRVDIEREVDLIEEVARIQGYERIAETLPRSPGAGSLPADAIFDRRVQDALLRAGLHEVRPVPFVSEDDLALMGDGPDDAIAIANPLRAEEGWLRTRLLPGLLHLIAQNRAVGLRGAALFEVGVVFGPAANADEPVAERRRVAFALWGQVGESWPVQARAFDVLDAKGVWESLAEAIGIGDWELAEAPGPPLHPGRSALIEIDGSAVGVLGEVHPRVCFSLGIEGRVAIGEFVAAPLQASAADGGFNYADVPRFPPARRDLAFVVAEDVPSGAVGRMIADAVGDRSLAATPTLFDVFRGGSLDPGSKSLAFAVEFRAPDRTLIDDEVDEAVSRIEQSLIEAFDARLRTG